MGNAHELSGKAAIVGAYEHPTRYAPDKSEWQLLAEASRGAILDAGLSKSHIDALFVPATASEGGYLGVCASVMAADYLGLAPRFIDETDVGGASLGYYVNRAVAGINAGLFKCALIAYGATTKSRNINVGTVTYNALSQADLIPIPDAFEQIYGTTIISIMGVLTQRYMHTYGVTPEQMAHVSVIMREHASRNPSAAKRDLISVDDVISSPMIASPLRKLNCCIVSDGAGAIIVADKDIIKESSKPPVWITGFGEQVMSHGGGLTDWSEETYTMVKSACDQAYSMSGKRPSDIDTAMIYDAFAYNVLVDLEASGFCGKGEGGAYAASGAMRLEGGAIPVNPDGGGLSSNHPGRRGIFMFIEAVKQLRGEAEGRQVANAKTAMCTATGSAFLCRRASSAHILEI
jgi:acetyl-CoA C-acetyltransferase